MPKLCDLPTITFPDYVDERFNKCAGAGCGKQCSRSEAYCHDCRRKAGIIPGKYKPVSERAERVQKPAARNAVGQRVATPKPAPSVSIAAPVCTPAPKPAKERDTTGMTRNQIKIVSVMLNRMDDLPTYADVAAHFKTDRETIASNVDDVCRLWDCTRGTLLETAYLKGFAKPTAEKAEKEAS